jgi:molybdopterin-guanine dinucleotide biosynthesis protein A
VAAGLTVVAEREGSYQDLGLRTIEDRRHGLGPIGGLHRALEDQAQRVEEAGDWLLLASCDLLGVRACWIEDLLIRRERGARVVAFRQQRWEPMPALYHLDLLPLVVKQIEQGPLALWQLIERAEHVQLPYPEDWSDTVQVNTPRDLERYLTRRA